MGDGPADILVARGDAGRSPSLPHGATYTATGRESRRDGPFPDDLLGLVMAPNAKEGAR